MPFVMCVLLKCALRIKFKTNNDNIFGCICCISLFLFKGVVILNLSVTMTRISAYLVEVWLLSMG